MILFHGSNVEVKEPKIMIVDRTHDFGFAFYLTEHQDQAEKWAFTKFFRNEGGNPVVSVFDWDEDITGFKFKKFEDISEEWLDLVCKCRSIKTYKHGYDIIKGKVADDRVAETVNFYLEGIITKEQALERLKYSKVNSQIAFCTEEVLKHLKFIKSYQVK